MTSEAEQINCLRTDILRFLEPFRDDGAKAKTVFAQIVLYYPGLQDLDVVKQLEALRDTHHVTSRPSKLNPLVDIFSISPTGLAALREGGYI